jgi:glycosyltransferase involved in cell wall biosynthesis
MKISVIIASYRCNDLVYSCVKSLQDQILQPFEVIIVVDWPDQQEEFIRFFKMSPLNLKVFASGKTGLSAARNKGVLESAGEVIVFIDDDATAGIHWLEEISRSFDLNPGIGVVGGPVKPIFEGNQIDEKWYWIIGCTSSNPPICRPIGCNIAIKKEIFAEIGGFDERLGRNKGKLVIGEETELLMRIEEKWSGSSVFWNSASVVYHRVPKSRTTLHYIVDRAYQEGIGKAIIGKKYELDLEKKFLRYYLRHLDFLTGIILLSISTGYFIGKIKKEM